MSIKADKLLNVFGFQVPVKDVNWQMLLLKFLPRKLQYFVFDKKSVNKMFSPSSAEASISEHLREHFVTLINSDALIKFTDIQPETSADYYILETDQPFIKTDDNYPVSDVIDLLKNPENMRKLGLDNFECYYSYYESGTWKKIDTIFISLAHYKDWDKSEQAMCYLFDIDTYQVLKQLFNYQSEFPESTVIVDDNCNFKFHVKVNANFNSESESAEEELVDSNASTVAIVRK